MAAAEQARKTLAIIGAAIAGPTFALQILSHPILCKLYRPILYDRCHDLTLNSREDVQQTAGAGIALFPNGLYPLQKLGLLPELSGGGLECRILSFWKADYGQFVAGNTAGAYKHLGVSSNPESSPELLPIERCKLQNILIEHVRKLGGEVFWNKRVKSLESQLHGRTRVIFEDAEQVDADLVVGADGAFSQVRRFILEKVDPRTADERWMPDFFGASGLYGITSGVDENEHSTATHAIWLADGNISTSPLPHGKLRWDLAVSEARKPEEFRGFAGMDVSVPQQAKWESKIVKGIYPHSYTVDILRKHVNVYHPVGGTFGNLLSKSDRIIHSPLRQRVWEKNEIQHEGVVLIGDAARAMLPSSGQGTSFAIEDATVLANALLNNPYSPQNKGFKAALTEYAELRVPRSEKMAVQAYYAGRIGLATTWYWRWLRRIMTFFATVIPQKSIGEAWPFNERLEIRERRHG